MNNKLVLIISVILMVAFTNNLNAQKIKTKTDTISYALGHDIGKNLKNMEVEINAKFLYNGIIDGLAGKNDIFSEEQIKEFMIAFQKDIQQKQQEKKAREAAENKKKGLEFLAGNKKKAGIIELPSGLQYKIIKEGTGAKPIATDKVKVHYEGTLIDGTVFDSSYERGTPISFSLNGVIKGWTEGLQLMKVGSIFMFYLSSDLAYGDKEPSPKIKAGSTLIFKVELIEIEKEIEQEIKSE